MVVLNVVYTISNTFILLNKNSAMPCSIGRVPKKAAAKMRRPFIMTESEEVFEEINNLLEQVFDLLEELDKAVGCKTLFSI